VVGGTPSTNADYHFRMDSFMVTKGAGIVLQDDFSDGLPPPNSPPLNSPNGPVTTTYAGLGSFAESGGKLFLDSSNAVSFVGVGTPDPFIGQDAIVRTNIDPANIGPGDLGLKVDNQFTITGVFDLVLPDSPRETYGIRFTDRLIGGMGTPPDQQGNNVVELVVREGVSGQLQVALRNLDFAGNVTTNIQSVALAPPPGTDQIILVLNHNPNDTFATASFKYINHNNPAVILGSQSFSAHAAIFQGENWGRAELVAYAPLFTDSLKVGTYGTLDIGQSGTWNYVLNNGLAATQSLAEGQHTTDSFTVQVADQFGLTDSRVINIDVIGSNDAPVLQTPPAFRSLTENGAPITATGLAQFADVDLADSHSMSTMLQSTTTTGGAIVSPGLATALQTALNAFIFDPSTRDGHGQYQWDFNLSDSAVQYLNAGQSVTANYLITVTDSSPSHAPAMPQLVTITINGGATPPPPPPPPPIVPTFATLDYPGAGYTLANDINDYGEVVGQTGAVAGSSYTGFDFAGGHFTPIAVTGATNTSANTVNDNGLVGGWYEPSGSTPRYGFTDLNGTYTPGISLLPNISTTVDGINNGGVFVGSLYHGGTSFSGYINNGGAVTQLDVSGAATTSANGINDGGDVVGSYNNAHGFLYHNGTYTTIDAPLGVNGTIAADINDSGQIVGWYTDASNKAHGFVDIAGVFTTIDDPLGVNGTYVRGINDMGQVVGWYTDAANVNHGFIANIAGGTVAMGFPSNDTLNGTPANDLILGLDGHDTMFSGLGNDVIDGGLGTDIVVYSGAYSGGLGPYTIAIMPGAIHASVSGPDGSDKLSNVELLSFSDAYVMASNNVDISVLGAGALVPLLPIIGISGGDFLTIGTNANGHPIDLGDGPFDNLFLNQPGPATYSLNLSNVEQVFGVSGDDETVNMVSALSGVIIDLGWGNDRLDLADGTNVADVRHVETINGGSGSDTLALGDAHTTTTVDGHGGADVFDLSAHSQSFVFHYGSLADSPAGFGHDTIDGFDASLDIIDLQGLSIHHWDVTGGVLHAYQAGSGTPDLEIALPHLLGTLDNSHVLF
jgi:VCBS repeat-containing protein